MNQREKEYREIFVAESLEMYDSLSRLVIDLEKGQNNEKVTTEIFRLLHNLKANAKAIGFLELSDAAHKLETAFSAVKSRQLNFYGNVVTVLLDGIDLLGALITNIDNDEYPGAPKEVLNNIDLLLSDLSGTTVALHNIKRYYTDQNISLSDLIYIRIKKLDDLLNLVGELIIDKDRLMSLGKESGNELLMTVCSHLHRITTELQNTVMDARLVNIGALFNKFPRIIRDIAIAENKNISLEVSGENIKIDRNILQVITDPLLHIVRNAINHGIEETGRRAEYNKKEEGLIRLAAYNDKDMVQIQITDDGKGIDVEEVKRHAIERNYVSKDRAEELNSTEVLSYIFEPGFSLSKNVNEYSGRGIGLDVVKNAIDSLGGKIEVNSEKGLGTTFSLFIPTSLAVKGALLFEVNNNIYAIPLIHAVYVFTADLEEVHQVGISIFIQFKSELIPIIYLNKLFASEEGTMDMGCKDDLPVEKQNIIVVSYNNRKVGLIVDKLIRQQDIVVKSLQKPVNNAELFGGVTLLGSGEVCLLLDVPSITRNIMTKI